MQDNSLSKPPTWFWWISGIGLAWNALGLMAFVSQMLMDPSTLRPDEHEFYANMPLWADIGFGVAVFGGVLGCVALLLKKSWAVAMLVVCVIGIVVQNLHSIVLANGIEVFGTAALALPVMTFLIGVGLAWFARHSQQKGWIR